MELKNDGKYVVVQFNISKRIGQIVPGLTKERPSKDMRQDLMIFDN